MPTDVKRALRVSARLARELAWLLAREVRDPGAANVTVTRVEMPDDLRSARVYVRLLEGGDDAARRKQALAGLRRASGMLRKDAARRMGLRYAPELRFFYDEAPDHTTRIQLLLDELHAEETARRG